MTVKILADSACDLPITFFQENSETVTLIPLNVHLDDQEFEDLVTISPKTVLDSMREGKTPKTSQVTPNAFEEVFKKLAEEKQDAIYIAFSSELSGTYQTGVMIAQQVKEENPDLNLTILDTKCASLGYGLIVKNAVEMAKNGKTKSEIEAYVQFAAKHMEHLFTVDDLVYLQRGGRISKASAFVGGLLNIKPLLNVEDGKLIPLEKIRGKKKLYKRIIEIMRERGDQLEKQEVGISHGDDEEAALLIKEEIEKEFGTKKFYINSIGAAVGSHSGPGTLAIFFLNKFEE